MFRSRALAWALALLAYATTLPACPSVEPASNVRGFDDASVRDSGGPPPKIVLMIGDGMGEGQLRSASYFKAGAPNALSMFDLPIQGRISTASPSGTTDSAASATAMASGHLTMNGTVGLDLDERPVQNIVETAKEYGLATGIVTDTRITHATPASFVAHVPSRGQYQDIAAHMAGLRPDVILGGGRKDFDDRSDNRNLITELLEGGYQVVHTASELAATDATTSPRLLGLFADYHLTYNVDLEPGHQEPSLSEMSMAAIERLDRDPEGFFLMIEGGRIDHASHENNIERAIGETLEFEKAIADVMEWAEGRDDVTLLVTADHECGGLEVITPRAAGTISDVSWRWGSHTNASVRIFGQGPGTGVFDGRTHDHRWVHAVIDGLVRNTTRTPPHAILPDGRLGDLLGPTIAQTYSTTDNLGGMLTRLSVGWNERGLGIGIEGLFPWNQGATLVLIDVDYGLATGIRSLDEISDLEGSADFLLNRADVPVLADNGFGIDFAFVSPGGLETKFEELLDTVGLRGLRPPYGSLARLGAVRSAANFSDNSRIRDQESDSTPGEGFEIFVRWQELYDGASAPPEGSRIAVWALQLDNDGDTTNQSLPPWDDAEADSASMPLVITP